MHAVAEASGLTVPQRAALSTLKSWPRTLDEIARATGKPAIAIGKVLSALQRKGYVVMDENCPGSSINARLWLLTRDGRRAVAIMRVPDRNG